MNFLSQFEQMRVRDKLIIICTASVILIAAFIQFVQKPNNEMLELRQNELAKQRDTLAAMETEVQKMPDPVQYLSELQILEQKVNNLLPDKDGVAEFLLTVNRLGKEQKININTIKRGIAVDKQTYYEIPLEISLSSTYQDLLMFINKMESLGRFNTITKISVQPNEQILNVKLAASVYVYGPLPKKAQDEAANK